MQKNNKTITMVLLIFLAFVFFYHLFLGRFGLTFSDEGHFLYSAQLINEGELPYKDYWIEQTPGSFYIQAIIFKIFGASIMTGRVSMAALAVIITLLLFIISKKLAPFPYNLIPSVLYCFWGISQMNIPWYSHYALLFCLIAAYFFINYLDKKRLIWLFYSALSTGICILMKQNLGAGCFLGIIIFLLITKKPRIDFLKKAFILFLGTAAPFLIMAAIYYNYHAINDLLYHIFSVASISTKTRLSLKVFPDIELPSITIIAFYLWLISCVYLFLVKKTRRALTTSFLELLVIILVVTFTPKLRQAAHLRHYLSFGLMSMIFNIPALCLLLAILKFRENRAFLFIVVFSSAYFLISLILGKDLIHVVAHLPVCFIAMSLIAFEFAKYLNKKFKKPAFLKISLIALPVFFIAMRGVFASINNEVQYVESLPKYKMAHKIESIARAKGIYVEEEKGRQTEQLINYVQSITDKNDYIFVFSSGQMIYFLTERKHPFIQTFFHDEIFYKENQPKVIEAVKEKNVRYVVLWNEKTDLAKWAQDKDSKYDIISKFILDNYKPDKDFGRFSVWVRKSQTAAVNLSNKPQKP